MRHRVYGKHLSRDKNQRTALFRSLVRDLFLHESIKTTEPKARAIKGLIDTLIVKGKKKDSASLRVLTSFLVQPELIKKLMEDIAPRYSDRPSGFTTMVRLGSRLGDGAMIVKMSLMPGTEKTEGTQDLRHLDPLGSQGSTVEGLDPEALKASKTPKKKAARPRKAVKK